MKIRNNTNETILHVGKKSRVIYGRTNKKSKEPKKPHTFVLMYSNEIAKNQINVSYILAKIALDIDSKNRIKIDSLYLHNLSKNFEISEMRLRHQVAEFVEKDIMIRTSPGEYFVNPNLFTKSNNREIRTIRDEYRQKSQELVNIEMQKSKIREKKLKEQNKELQSEIEQEKTLSAFKELVTTNN